MNQFVQWKRRQIMKRHATIVLWIILALCGTPILISAGLWCWHLASVALAITVLS